jgi:hypothetical protein
MVSFQAANPKPLKPNRYDFAAIRGEQAQKSAAANRC